MRLGERGTQALGGRRRQDEVDVIGHQTLGEAPNALRGAGVGDEVAIDGIILIAEEDRLAPIAALGDVVGDVGNHQAGEAAMSSTHPWSRSGAIVLCPRNFNTIRLRLLRKRGN